MTHRSVRLPNIFRVSRQYVKRCGKFSPAFTSYEVSVETASTDTRVVHYATSAPFSSVNVHVRGGAGIHANDHTDFVTIGIGSIASDAVVYLSPDQARKLHDALTPIIRGMELDETEPEFVESEYYNPSGPF